MIACVLLSACNNDMAEQDIPMTYEDMLKSPTLKQTLDDEIYTFNLDLEELQTEDAEILLLEKKDCKITVKASCVDKRTYDLYFDCVAYASENNYHIYSLQSYFEYNDILAPYTIDVVYKANNNIVTKKLDYYTVDLDNVPNLTYRLQLDDDIIAQLGTEENIEVEVIVENYCFQQATK